VPTANKKNNPDPQPALDFAHILLSGKRCFLSMQTAPFTILQRYDERMAAMDLLKKLICTILEKILCRSDKIFRKAFL
jgi:hypothetical protein